MPTKSELLQGITSVVEPGNPLGVAGLIFWLQPESLSSLSNGDSVSDWNNENPRNQILENGKPVTHEGQRLVTERDDSTQTDPGAQPEYITNHINDSSAVVFDGTTDFMSLPSFSHLTSGEIFIVLKNADIVPADSHSGAFTLGTSGSGSILKSSNYKVYDDFGSDTVKESRAIGKNFSDCFVYNAYSAPNDWASFVDGQPLHSTSSNTVSFPAEGFLGKAASGDFWNGAIAEVIIYDRKLSSEERSAVTNALGAKYGIELALTGSAVQTGTARITASVVESLAGTARIGAAESQSISGTSRVETAKTRTSEGTARVTVSKNVTAIGSARIQQAEQRELAGQARITSAASEELTGTARVQKASSEDQLGQARVTASTSEILQATARIQTSESASVTGQARLTKAGSEILTGTARIERASTFDNAGQARVTNAASQTLAGTARILRTEDAAVSGTARITVANSGTAVGSARIQKSEEAATTGQARVAKANSESLPGTARIQRTGTDAVSGRARVTSSISHGIEGGARIVRTEEAILSGTARIQTEVLENQEGTARVTKAQTAALTGTASITSKHYISSTVEGQAVLQSNPVKIAPVSSEISGEAITSSLINVYSRDTISDTGYSTLAEDGKKQSSLATDGILYSSLAENGILGSDIDPDGTADSNLDDNGLQDSDFLEDGTRYSDMET